MTEQEKIVDRKKTKRTLIYIVLGFVFFIFYQIKDKTSAFSNPSETTDNQAVESVNKEVSDYSGNKCAECNKNCKLGSEIYSSGDAMSGYKPYYLCGDTHCVNIRYEKDMRMKKYETQEQQYRNDMQDQGQEEATLHVN